MHRRRMSERPPAPPPPCDDPVRMGDSYRGMAHTECCQLACREARRSWKYLIGLNLPTMCRETGSCAIVV